MPEAPTSPPSATTACTSTASTATSTSGPPPPTTPPPSGPCDVVLVCVKAYDTDTVARTHLPHLVGAHTTVVSLQNGIDNEERLAAAIGDGHVIGGLALIFSSIAEPGVIAHTGGPAKLVVGELDGRPGDRVQRLAQWATAAGIDLEVSDDIRLALWHKYAFICAQAATTAAVRRPLGDIRAAPACWQLFRRLVEEVYQVADAAGVAIPDRAVEERLPFAESRVFCMIRGSCGASGQRWA